MDSITVGRPIKNRLGAHACHSFLSVPASQTVVSLCTIFLPSLHLYSLFYRLPVDKPANRLAEHCLYVCTYFSFFFSPLWTWSTNVVLDFISPQFCFFFCLFPCPTSSLCSFPSSSPLCPDLEMLWASTNGDAYDPHGQINHRYHSYKYSNEQIILR